MYPKKVLAKKQIFRVTKVCEHFWNQRKILDFLIPILAYLKGKNFDPYLVDFLLFGDQKCHFRNEPLNIQKNLFNKLILDFCLGSKSSWKRSEGKNRLPLVNIYASRVGMHIQTIFLKSNRKSIDYGFVIGFSLFSVASLPIQQKYTAI
jgi:hypothetical protein